MNKLTPLKVEELLSDSHKPAVTIYQPTHRASTPPNITEDQIRFKNLTHLAVKENGEENDSTRKIANHLAALETDVGFWEHQTEGLAVMATEDGVETLNLPLETEEYAICGSGFFITPLLGIKNELLSYYVLVVSQKNPKLYKGDRYGLRVSGIELPTSIAQALNIDEMHQRSVQFQTQNRGSAPMYHGHGAGKETGDEERLYFWRAIDKVLLEHTDRDCPLLLAGIDNEVEEYRRVSRYPRLLEDYLRGEHHELDTEKLFSLVWPHIEELVRNKRRRAIQTFNDLTGQNPKLTSTSPEAIANAAKEGRVERLMVGLRRRTTDTVEDNLGRVSKIVFKAAEKMHKVEELVRAVRGQGGEVWLVEEHELPLGKLVGATYRY